MSAAPTPTRAAAFWLRLRTLLGFGVPMPAPDYPTVLCDDAEQVDALDDYAVRYWT